MIRKKIVVRQKVKKYIYLMYKKEKGHFWSFAFKEAYYLYCYIMIKIH